MYVEVVVDVLGLTAVWGTAEIGKVESESSDDDKGNFLVLLILITKCNDMDKRKLKVEHTTQKTPICKYKMKSFILCQKWYLHMV